MVTPEDSHISVLIEGIYAFPSNKKIDLYLATLYMKTGNLKEARRLIDHYYPGRMDPTLRTNFKNLAEWLSEAEASL